MELEIIKGAGELLSNHGNIELAYLTAEFEPFSNQQKPDLIFRDKKKMDCVYFIEYKSKPKQGFSKNYVNSIVEHKEFVSKSIELNTYYAFATNDFVPIELQKVLMENEIFLMNNVNSSKELFIKIKDWYEKE